MNVGFSDFPLNTKFDRQIELLTNKTTKSMGITELILDLAKKDGIEIGERRGLEKGKLNAKKAIARQLKSLGVAPAIISKSTGLTLRKVREL